MRDGSRHGVANLGPEAPCADVSLATVYKNFSGKDEIWDALNRQRMDEFIAAGQDATRDVDTPLNRFYSAMRMLVRYFTEHPNFLGLHINEGLNWATAGVDWGRGNQRDAWKTGRGTMVALAEDKISSGETPSMRPAEEVANKLVEDVKRSLTIRSGARTL